MGQGMSWSEQPWRAAKNESASTSESNREGCSLKNTVLTSSLDLGLLRDFLVGRLYYNCRICTRELISSLWMR